MHQIGRCRFLQQTQGVRLHPEAEPLCEADGPEQAGGIVHEASVMQHSDCLSLQVTQTAANIEQFAEASSVQWDGQCIDRKVPAKEIFLKGAGFHDGQGGRMRVGFAAGGGHVKLDAMRKHQHGCAKTVIDLHVDAQVPPKCSRKRDPVAFDDEIQIEVLDAEQQVSHEPAHDKGTDRELVRQCARLTEQVRHVLRHARFQRLA